MNKKIFNLFNIFIIFLVSVILLQQPPKSYSKYQTSINSNNSDVEVASFVFLSSAQVDLPLTLNESLYPGIYTEYYFTIQNYNNNIVSDINLSYTLKINKTNNLPIDVKIYKNDLLLNLQENNSFDFQLNKNTKTLDNYKIVISWDENYDDFNYANLSDNISLSIVANQID